MKAQATYIASTLGPHSKSPANSQARDSLAAAATATWRAQSLAVSTTHSPQVAAYVLLLLLLLHSRIRQKEKKNKGQGLGDGGGDDNHGQMVASFERSRPNPTMLIERVVFE